jgi:hypothetical protein
MIRGNVVEEEEVIMSMFLNGLNRDIANVVELQPYMDLNDLMHLAIKVEKHIKRKSSACLYGLWDMFLVGSRITEEKVVCHRSR